MKKKMKALCVMLFVLAITTLNSCTKSYTLTVESDDPTMGTVVGGGEYVKGTTASIGAIPNDGFVFVKWDDGNTDNPRELEMNQDITLKAIFRTIDVVGKWRLESVTAIQGGQTYTFTVDQIYSMLGIQDNEDIVVEFRDNGYFYFNEEGMSYVQDGYQLTITSGDESIAMEIVELTSDSLSLQMYNAQQNATITLHLSKI